MRTLVAAMFMVMPWSTLAEPIALKGLTPGMTKAQLEAAHPGITLRCFTPDPNPTTTELCGSHGDNFGPLATFAGVKATYITHLKGDLVHTVTVALAPDDFETAVAAVTERYGKPASRRESVISNRMGAKFDQVEVRWVVQDTALYGAKRAGKIDTSSFHLTSKTMSEERDKARKDAAKKGAHDM